MHHKIIRGLVVAALTVICGAASAGTAIQLERRGLEVPDLKPAGPKQSQAGRTTLQRGPAVPGPLQVLQPELVVYDISHWPKQLEGGDNVVLYFGISNHGPVASHQGGYVLWVNCYNTSGPGASDCPFPEQDSHILPAIDNKGPAKIVELATQPWPAGDYGLTAWVRKAGTGPGVLGTHQQHLTVGIHVADTAGPYGKASIMQGANGKPSLTPSHPPDPIKPSTAPATGFAQLGQVHGFNPQSEPPAVPAGGFAQPQFTPQLSKAAMRQRLLATARASSPGQPANALPPGNPQGGSDDLWLTCSVRNTSVTIQPAHYVKPKTTPMHSADFSNKNPDTGQANAVTLPPGTEVLYLIGVDLEDIHKHVLSQSVSQGESFKSAGLGAPDANQPCIAVALEVFDD